MNSFVFIVLYLVIGIIVDKVFNLLTMDDDKDVTLMIIDIFIWPIILVLCVGSLIVYGILSIIEMIRGKK